MQNGVEDIPQLILVNGSLDMKIAEVLVRHLATNATMAKLNVAATGRDKNLTFLFFGVDTCAMPLILTDLRVRN